MSPLTWQILKNKREVVFSLIEASSKIDNGKIYHKKKIKIPRHLLFEDIKNIQLKQNILLIKKVLNFLKENKKYLQKPNMVKVPSLEKGHQKIVREY